LLNEVRRWPGGYQHLKEQLSALHSNGYANDPRNCSHHIYLLDIIWYNIISDRFYHLTKQI
jgi:hypothetical protein